LFLLKKQERKKLTDMPRGGEDVSLQKACCSLRREAESFKGSIRPTQNKKGTLMRRTDQAGKNKKDFMASKGEVSTSGKKKRDWRRITTSPMEK